MQPPWLSALKPRPISSTRSSARTSFDISEQVSDRLVQIEPGNSALQPGLAKSWTVSSDGLQYTFKLRHEVKWQSNEIFTPTRPMNADDVVFSFKRMSDQSDPFYKTAGGNFPEFIDLLEPNLVSITRAGDDTVIVTLKSPDAALLPALSIPALLDPFSRVCGTSGEARQARAAGHKAYRYWAVQFRPLRERRAGALSCIRGFLGQIRWAAGSRRQGR